MIGKAHRERYGNPRVWQTLTQKFPIRISRKRVERLIRKRGLKTRRKKSGMNTTESKYVLPVAENMLNRKFRVCGPE
ncbi:MAG: IS3 family transposase [Spirochaetaceae bacterium]|nr:IS3 family transposase [Spirochaetaceae bacterium]